MIKDIPHLGNYIKISENEANIYERVGLKYPWQLTEYYASLIDPDDMSCPIRLQSIPDIRELETTFGEDDPLTEDENSPVPGVIRVYPDRIAVIVTNKCPVYCRHCLRKRFTRDRSDDLKGQRLETVLSYIRKDRAIRDVLLTGGDPLMLSDNELDGIIGGIRSIPHVEIIRVGTRALCTWPERVTDEFAKMLASYHPVWVSTQFNHPREITQEAENAVDRLLKQGIPVNNQSVLLREINDSVDTMLKLNRKLVSIRVRPYYLYQAQTLAGTKHFVTTVEKGLEIIKGLRGWTTGFAVPQYVLDTPCGKIPLNPNYLTGRDGDFVEMLNYRGEHWREYNPLP
ncbi:MAG: KamA family radical SAM protein [Candidatus Latescibacteria bacterium]|nr:KamA family radical SAM protein [Candidatus Latescibacterota bacterium]